MLPKAKETLFSKRNALIALVAIIFVASIGSAVYFYLQTVNLKKSPADATVQESKQTVDRVSRLILLPKDEIPTIATVSDPTALSGQPFFNTAEKGDQVLIYSNAKQAILYRPASNIIVNVAPINLGGSGAQGSELAPVTPETKK